MSEQQSERDTLLQMMQDADNGVDVDAKYGAKATDEQPAKETEAKAKEPPPEAKPAEVKKEEKPAEPAEKPADSSLNKEAKEAQSEVKPKSKWAANEERKARTWEQINAEKEAIKAEREALQRERDEVLKKQAVSSPAEKFRDERGFTAQDYRDAAKKFAEGGDQALATAAEQRAAELEQKETMIRQKAEQDEFGRKWAAKYQELSTKVPALKDPNSEEYKQVVNLLNQYPLLTRDANGLEYAVKAVQLERAAADSATKDSKIKELTDQLAKLQSKLSIGSGVPAEPPKAEKAFEDMTLAEQRQHLERAARKADRDAGFAP